MQWGQGPGLSYHDLGETGGEPTVTLLQTAVPSHPHTLQASARPADLDTPGPQNALGRSTPAFIYKQPAGAAAPQPLAAGIMGAPAGNGQPHNNMMPTRRSTSASRCRASTHPAHDHGRAARPAPAPGRAGRRRAATKEAFLRMQFAAQDRYYHATFPGASYDLIVRGDGELGRLYLDRGETAWLVIDLALLPGHRGQGIGTRLLTEILAEAGLAAKPVQMHVERFNPARRLYHRLGFHQIADQGVYLLLEHDPQPDRESAGQLSG